MAPRCQCAVPCRNPRTHDAADRNQYSSNTSNTSVPDSISRVRTQSVLTAPCAAGHIRWSAVMPMSLRALRRRALGPPQFELRASSLQLRDGRWTWTWATPGNGRRTLDTPSLRPHSSWVLQLVLGATKRVRARAPFLQAVLHPQPLLQVRVSRGPWPSLRQPPAPPLSGWPSEREPGE